MNPWEPKRTHCFLPLLPGQILTDLLHSLTASLGFKHKAKGVVDSIVNGKELEKFIKDQIN